MENIVSKTTSNSLSFQQMLSDLKLDMFECDGVEAIETEEKELGFMFSKGGGSRPRSIEHI